jgi:glycosyltransferase involved in cell wall biosynthesis
MSAKLSSIDVVVPCYNYGRYLRCCVRSVLDQSGVDVRVLIIDDASSDETAEIGQALAREDSRVTFWRHAVNRGNINTYNEGIQWASADYFLLLSADDWMLPGALARAAEVFESHPEVVLVHGNAAVARVGQAAPEIRESGPCEYAVESGHSFIAAVCSKSDYNPVWTPTAIVRTADQKAVGGYSTELPHAGDLHLWLTLACRGSIAKIENQQAVYRRHDANMHYSFSKLKNLRQHLLAFDTVFGAYSEKINDHAALQKQYRKGLALSAIHLAQRDAVNNRGKFCEEYLTFAFALAPALRRSAAYLQLQVLRMGGHRLARAIKPVLQKLRNLRAHGLKFSSKTSGEGYRVSHGSLEAEFIER